MPNFDLQWEAGVRLVVALLLTGLVGFERERGHKPAGLRTHMLVGLGAACFTVATLGVYAAAGVHAADPFFHDPIRMIQGLIGGIGFLGAGAIIRRDEGVEGLTTAGSIWLVGAIGMTAGLGLYVLAVMTTALALLVLAGLGFIERRWLHSSSTSPPNPA